MDLTKKRKADENGRAYPVTAELGTASPFSFGIFLPKTRRKFSSHSRRNSSSPFYASRSSITLMSWRLYALSRTQIPSSVNCSVRGLGWETTTEKLRQVFSSYGGLDEANSIVITDKTSGKSKGYGFVTFKHIDAAILALKEPNKKIDGRITVTQLAAAGNSGHSHSSDVALRKIYVGNIPFEISSERLLAHFSMYGEIEEGPLGFDKQTGKAKGFAFFVYKTEDGAKASLVDPMKTIDGHQLLCKLATDNKKQKPNVGPPGAMAPGMPNSGPMGMPARNYGMTGYMGYGPGPNMPQPPHQNVGYNTGMGGPGGQGYGSGYGIYDGVGGPGAGEYSAGMGNTGDIECHLVALGMQNSGGYPDSGNYGHQSSYPAQPNQPVGPGPRLPAYQGMPPY